MTLVHFTFFELRFLSPGYSMNGVRSIIYYNFFATLKSILADAHDLVEFFSVFTFSQVVKLIKSFAWNITHMSTGNLHKINSRTKTHL